jgi:hypothetical protein
VFQQGFNSHSMPGPPVGGSSNTTHPYSARDSNYATIQREEATKRMFAAAIAGDVLALDQTLKMGEISIRTRGWLYVFDYLIDL